MNPVKGLIANKQVQQGCGHKNQYTKVDCVTIHYK